MAINWSKRPPTTTIINKCVQCPCYTLKPKKATPTPTIILILRIETDFVVGKNDGGNVCVIATVLLPDCAVNTVIAFAVGRLTTTALNIGIAIATALNLTTAVGIAITTIN